MMESEHVRRNEEEKMMQERMQMQDVNMKRRQEENSMFMQVIKILGFLSLEKCGIRIFRSFSW